MADVPPDPTIKKIVLTAETAGSLAPKSMEGGAEIKRRGSRRASRRAGASTPAANSPIVVTKVSASGGGATSPGTMQQLAASHIPGNDVSKATGAVAPATASLAPIGVKAPAAADEPAAAAGLTKGGAQEAKVTLVKSRKAPRKVMLAAAKTPHAVAHTHMKRKTVKKVKVSLTSLGKRLHRAKTIRKKASKHTLDEIKKGLVEAKLVKADTKAPEDVLRQMYADYMTLKKKAL